MYAFLGEFLGTMILVLLGNGVVANVVLAKSKGEGSGWIVITAGWGCAVAVAVYVTGWMTGAHINPAVTAATLATGGMTVAEAFAYIAGQMAGAMAGAALVFVTYYAHFKESSDKDGKLACFSTAPAIRNYPLNFTTEFIGTAMLVIGVMGITHPGNEIAPFIGPLLIGILVFSLGLSLGGPTGYAINPARDLGPRLAYAILPVPGKRDPDWGYAWVPVLGPLAGGVFGGLAFQFFLSVLNSV